MHLPEFFPFIYPSFVGFGGPVVVLVLFKVIMHQRRNIPVGHQVLMAILVYVGSVMTGYACDELNLTDLTSAYYVSGFWAPTFYCILVSIWMRRKYYQEEKMSDIDHLID